MSWNIHELPSWEEKRKKKQQMQKKNCSNIFTLKTRTPMNRYCTRKRLRENQITNDSKTQPWKFPSPLCQSAIMRAIR